MVWHFSDWCIGIWCGKTRAAAVYVLEQSSCDRSEIHDTRDSLLQYNTGTFQNSGKHIKYVYKHAPKRNSRLFIRHCHQLETTCNTYFRIWAKMFKEQGLSILELPTKNNMTSPQKGARLLRPKAMFSLPSRSVTNKKFIQIRMKIDSFPRRYAKNFVRTERNWTGQCGYRTGNGNVHLYPGVIIG
jgi:hypothetical protein